MWCEVYFHGPYFFENAKGRTVTVNAEQFKVILETFLCSELTSSSARFAVVPTRWSNSSYSTNFHASPQDIVSQQTHFLF
jgi:hypothetical protein